MNPKDAGHDEPMSQPNPFDLSAEDQATLIHDLNLLHLFYHRNRNQHRHSIWWRHFAVFRRQLNAFHTEMTRYHSATSTTAPRTHLARTREKAHAASLVSRNTARRRFWRDVLVPRAHDAFTQLVADGRFAVLGLVLLAVLAEVCRVLGLAAEMEAMGHEVMEEVLAEFAREEWGDDVGKAGSEDVGEVVARPTETVRVETRRTESALGKRRRRNGEAQLTTEVGEGGDDKLMAKAEEVAMTLAPAKKKVKKRKKGNAIDDLFSGL